MVKKKVKSLAIGQRLSMLELNNKIIKITSQLKLLAIPKSTYYLNLKDKKDKNISLKEAISQIYETKPFYGYRKIKVELLKKYNQNINGKKIMKLKKELSLETIYPKIRTTIINKEHHKHAYLVKAIEI